MTSVKAFGGGLAPPPQAPPANFAYDHKDMHTDKYVVSYSVINIRAVDDMIIVTFVK